MSAAGHKRIRYYDCGTAEHFLLMFRFGYTHFGIEAARIQLTDIFGFTPKEANEALLKAMRIPA